MSWPTRNRMAKKTVLIGLPTSDGTANVMTVKRFLEPVDTFDVSHITVESHLLGAFNKCWGAAITNYKMLGLDYFALIHSDIVPEENWLQKMVTELESNKLDILSVVAPIKSPDGLTSTVVEENGSLRNLTLNELQGIGTFTHFESKQVLVNTGLLLVKMGDWIEDVVFRMESTMKEDGTISVLSEDYAFSKDCLAKDLKIGATMKVELYHDKPFFSNLVAKNNNYVDT